MPRVSVIMAVYNSAKYLPEAVESLLNQTHANWELLAADDGSHDRSIEILRGFHDERIRVIELPANLGPAGARNAALAEARGEFIAVLDSDDICRPHRFFRSLEICGNRPDIAGVVSVHPGILPVCERPAYTMPALLFRNVTYHSSLFYRAPASRYEQRLRFAHDYELICRLGEKGLLLTREQFSFYREHAENVSHNHAEAQRNFAMEVQARMLAKLAVVPSTEEARAHFALGLGQVTSLAPAAAWLGKLERAQKTTGAFDSAAFRETCGTIWYQTCLNAAVPLGQAARAFIQREPANLPACARLIWTRLRNRARR
jgi:glycosyltransferase involved in cell wall biosynthesis